MLLLQGMFARGRTVFKVVPDVVRVPLESLLEQIRENDHNTVFVVDPEKKAVLTRIKIGSADPKFAQVLEGLKSGDTVVVQGKEILSSGQPLEPMEIQRNSRPSGGKIPAEDGPRKKDSQRTDFGRGGNRS